MAKKVYTVEQVKEMYKDNFYVQHKEDMQKADVDPSTPEIDKADLSVAFVIVEQKYGKKPDLLARAQYNHYCDVIATEKNGRPIDTLSVKDRRLLRESGVEV